MTNCTLICAFKQIVIISFESIQIPEEDEFRRCSQNTLPTDIPLNFRKNYTTFFTTIFIFSFEISKSEIKCHRSWEFCLLIFITNELLNDLVLLSFAYTVCHTLLHDSVEKVHVYMHLKHVKPICDTV